MSINTVTHINLRGDARAALEFYQSVFGGNLVVLTYTDVHNVQNPPRRTRSCGVRSSPKPASTSWPTTSPRPPPTTPARSRSSSRARHRRRRDHRLLGQAHRPGHHQGAARPASFSPLYGMVTDQFGVTWVLDVAIAHNPA